MPDSEAVFGSKDGTSGKMNELFSKMSIDKHREDRFYPLFDGLVSQFMDLNAENILLRHQVELLQEQLRNLDVKPNEPLISLDQTDPVSREGSHPPNLNPQIDYPSSNQPSKAFSQLRSYKLPKLIQKAKFHTENRNSSFIPSQTKTCAFNYDKCHKDIIWDLDNFQCLDGSSACISDAGDWSRLVISASADGTCKIWDIEYMNLMATYNEHLASVNSIKVIPCYSQDSFNRTVCSASDDGSIHMWDIPEDLINILQENNVNDLSSSEISSGSSNYENLPQFPLRQRNVLISDSKEGAIISVDSTSDYANLVSLSLFGIPRLWDLTTGQSTPLSINAEGPLFSIVRCHVRESRAVFASKRGYVLLCDIGNFGISGGPNAMLSFAAHENVITSVRFVPETYTILTAGQDGCVKHYDSRYGGKVLSSLRLNSHVVSMDVSPQGLVSIALSNGSFYVCDVKKMKYVNKLLEPDSKSCHKKAITCCRWTLPPEGIPAVGNEEKSLNTSSSSPLQTNSILQAYRNSKYPPSTSSCSVPGNFSQSLVTANLDHTLTHWNFSFLS